MDLCKAERKSNANGRENIYSFSYVTLLGRHLSGKQLELCINLIILIVSANLLLTWVV